MVIRRFFVAGWKIFRDPDDDVELLNIKRVT